MSDTNHTLIFKTVKVQTAAALLIVFQERKTSKQKEVWIPKSQVRVVGNELHDVPEWLVEKHDLWDWSI